MAVSPLSLPALSSEITALRTSISSIQATIALLSSDVVAIKASLGNIEAEVANTSATIFNLSSQILSVDIENDIMRSAMQQAISSLAIMVEEIRKGDVGSVPAEMNDLLSALARIGGTA